jgi:hypothetical protein
LESEVLLEESVRLDFVVLGDFAQAVNGKLTVVGAGWTLVHAQQYPVTIPVGIGIGILVPWSETNRKHSFRFLIKHSEHATGFDGGGEFEVGRQPGIPTGMEQRVAFGFAGQLKLQEPGTYELIVECAADSRRASRVLKKAKIGAVSP